MTESRGIRPTLHDERGQSMVFVLVFIAVFSMLLPAVLGFASSGLLGGKNLADLARQREASEAGAEYGLARVRAGAVGALSGPSSITEGTPSQVNGESVSVTMARRAITGIVIEQVPGSVAPAGPGCEGHYRVKTTNDGAVLPYGVVWTVSPAPVGTSLDQAGLFVPGAADTTYTLRAVLANLQATLAVAVGNGACP